MFFRGFDGAFYGRGPLKGVELRCKGVCGGFARWLGVVKRCQEGHLVTGF